MSKQTREQLLIENNVLKQEISSLKTTIENRIENARLLRKEFSKAFNWIEQDPYSRTKEPSDISWEQIFIEIGRLLQIAEKLEYKESIEQIRKENYQLQDMINNLKNEKPNM